MYSMIKKAIHLFISDYVGSFNLCWKRSTKFNIDKCPSYGVKSVRNIIGICRFYNSVANCDKWPNYKGDQLHKYYCTILFSV